MFGRSWQFAGHDDVIQEPGSACPFDAWTDGLRARVGPALTEALTLDPERLRVTTSRKPERYGSVPIGIASDVGDESKLDRGADSNVHHFHRLLATVFEGGL